MIGSVLDHKIHRGRQARSSKYLFLLSGFIVLSDEYDTLSIPHIATKERGSHLTRSVKNSIIELRDWNITTSTLSFSNRRAKVIRNGINPVYYLLGV